METKTQVKIEANESKTGMGVLLGLFLGLIGLIIGLCLYKENTVERQTFVKGWAIAFVISVIVEILGYALLIGTASTLY